MKGASLRNYSSKRDTYYDRAGEMIEMKEAFHVFGKKKSE